VEFTLRVKLSNTSVYRAAWIQVEATDWHYRLLSRGKYF